MKTRTDILPAIDRAVFRVISDADWERELRAARARRNEMRERIAKILAQQQQLKKENEQHGQHR